MRSLLARFASTAIVLFTLAWHSQAGVVYVRQSATGANNGTSWADAFTELRVALSVVAPGDQVWVAAGTYKPAPSGGSVDARFSLSGISLFGGFAGTELSVDQRDWRANVTTLSGDIASNDGAGWPGADNALTLARFHAGSCVLDGFTLTGANSQLQFYADSGAVLVDGGSNHVVRNCLFRRNTGTCVLIWDDCPTSVVQSLFTGNRCDLGLVRSIASTRPIVRSSTFVDTQAWPAGSGPTVLGQLTDAYNCILWINATPAIASTASVQYSNAPVGGTGNIYADPRFVDVLTGDLRLLSISPCIDAGSNAALPAGLVRDYNGNPRRMDTPGSPGGGDGHRPVVDMGAFEFVPDCNGNAIPDTAEFATDDVNQNNVLDECEPVGADLCVGDGSSAACPCANTSPPGSGAGCRNSTGRSGRLRAFGVASVGEDRLVLAVNGLGASSPALYFQGDGLDLVGGVGGLPFGDGLRCVYGTIIRLGVKHSVQGASMLGRGVGADAPLSVTGAMPPWGGTRYYQVWYRDAASFCTLSTFNMSSGVAVAWGA